MQMAIGALDAADEQQDRAESALMRQLATEKEKRRVGKIKEQQRLAREQEERREERERWEEVDKMRRSMDRMQQEEKEQERLREDLKRENRRKQRDAEHQAAEREAAEALRKAKNEAKKARDDAARASQEANLARERAERAEAALRQQSTARSESEQLLKTQLKESTAWAMYTDQWELFKRFSLVAGAGAGGSVFRFEDIPWPTLTPPTSPSMITKKEVEAFLFSSFSNQGKPLKTRIRECLLIWHPDKFSGR